MVLVRQRCLIHTEREAAARCGQCGRFFCRECVTEHDGAMTCASCLRELAAARHKSLKPRVWSGAWMVGAVRGIKVVLAVGATWLFFHLIGHSLHNSSDEFHADAVWDKVTGADRGSSGD